MVRELEQDYYHPNVTFLDGGTLGLDLLAYLEDYHYLLIIDAFDIGDQPGKVLSWQGNTAKVFSDQMSFHQVGLKELLQAVRLLGWDLEIAVMGIQVEELSWGLELSARVQKAVPHLKEVVIQQICQFLNYNVS